jgi:short-subunit dehydrogenase
VTGASHGLGRVFARALAARKQNVILVARAADKLETLARELRSSQSVLAETLPRDLAVPGAGLGLARSLRERGLQVDLLINNAGFGDRGEFWKLSLDRQLQMIHLHSTVVVELTFSLLPPMIEQHRGGIINISSMAGFQPIPFAALYSATKSFLTTFSMAMAEELRQSNIGVVVVTVCPGVLQPDPEKAAAQAGSKKTPGGRRTFEEVVAETLKKLESGGGLVITGFENRLGVAIQRLIPRSAVPKLAAKLSRRS